MSVQYRDILLNTKERRKIESSEWMVNENIIASHGIG